MVNVTKIAGSYLIDLIADVRDRADGERLNPLVVLWRILRDLWDFRPVITTHRHIANVRLDAGIAGFCRGIENTSQPEAATASADPSRHAERTTSTGAVLVAVV